MVNRNRLCTKLHSGAEPADVKEAVHQAAADLGNGEKRLLSGPFPIFPGSTAAQRK